MCGWFTCTLSSETTVTVLVLEPEACHPVELDSQP
jgi:hypothetical protein